MLQAPMPGRLPHRREAVSGVARVGVELAPEERVRAEQPKAEGGHAEIELGRRARDGGGGSDNWLNSW